MNDGNVEPPTPGNLSDDRKEWIRGVLLPATFVWLVTVLPRLYYRGVIGVPVSVFGALSWLGLWGSFALYRRGHAHAKSLALWGFGLPCLAVYVVSRPSKMDPISMVAGFLGWGLFALACAGSGTQESRSWSRKWGRSIWPFWMVLFGCTILVGVAGVVSLPPRNLASIAAVLVASLVLFELTTRGASLLTRKLFYIAAVVLLLSAGEIALASRHDLLALPLLCSVALILTYSMRRNR